MMLAVHHYHQRAAQIVDGRRRVNLDKPEVGVFADGNVSSVPLRSDQSCAYDGGGGERIGRGEAGVETSQALGIFASSSAEDPIHTRMAITASATQQEH